MPNTVENTIRALMASRQVRTALEFMKGDHGLRVREMKELAQLAAESGMERLERGPRYLEMLRREGAVDCLQDDRGNAVGSIPGTGGGRVLLEAALDTVFPMDTPLALRHEDGLIYCPGIADGAGGLALNLAVLRSIRHAGLQPLRHVMVAGTAGSRSTGVGIRKILDDYPDILASVSVDGDGHDRVGWSGDRDGMALQTAVAASRALRLAVDLDSAPSPNAAILAERGVPALSLGYGGISRDVGSVTESYDPREAYLASQKTLLVVLALTGVEGASEPAV